MKPNNGNSVVVKGGRNNIFFPLWLKFSIKFIELRSKFIKTNILIMFLLFSFTAIAKENIVEITKISDGDTVKVMLDGEEIGIRMLKIDCFETSKNRRAIKQSEYYHIPIGEVFKRGNYSKQKLKDKLSKDNKIKLEWEKKDKYNRVLGTIYTLDGENINDYMLNDGGCVEYIPFTYKNKSKP